MISSILSKQRFSQLIDDSNTDNEKLKISSGAGTRIEELSDQSKKTGIDTRITLNPTTFNFATLNEKNIRDFPNVLFFGYSSKNNNITSKKFLRQLAIEHFRILRVTSRTPWYEINSNIQLTANSNHYEIKCIRTPYYWEIDAYELSFSAKHIINSFCEYVGGS
jgi:hypothetical protein